MSQTAVSTEVLNAAWCAVDASLQASGADREATVEEVTAAAAAAAADTEVLKTAWRAARAKTQAAAAESGGAPPSVPSDHTVSDTVEGGGPTRLRTRLPMA